MDTVAANSANQRESFRLSLSKFNSETLQKALAEFLCKHSHGVFAECVASADYGGLKALAHFIPFYLLPHCACKFLGNFILETRLEKKEIINSAFSALSGKNSLRLMKCGKFAPFGCTSRVSVVGTTKLRAQTAKNFALNP